MSESSSLHRLWLVYLLAPDLPLLAPCLPLLAPCVPLIAHIGAGASRAPGNMLNDGDFQDLWRFDLRNNSWRHILGPSFGIVFFCCFAI